MHRSPRCGAKCKRTGQPCRMPAMANGRCFLHGGKSTGAKTNKGLARCRKTGWKHGLYSREALDRRREIRRLLNESRKLLRQIQESQP
ncbi:MAG TPA: HGGxSTG domain-containing protein [bacterium]|nr:HGGxSTG domain-containing protein [bacterium]